MPYRICKLMEVESGHMLSKHPANCRFPHGHSRKVELTLEADTLNANDMVCDFGVLKKALIESVERFDHAICINTDDKNYPELKELYHERVIAFEKVDPTSEVMAKLIFDDVTEYLNNIPEESVRLIRVRIWETSTSWAEFSI